MCCLLKSTIVIACAGFNTKSSYRITCSWKRLGMLGLGMLGLGLGKLGLGLGRVRHVRVRHVRVRHMHVRVRWFLPPFGFGAGLRTASYLCVSIAQFQSQKIKWFLPGRRVVKNKYGEFFGFGFGGWIGSKRAWIGSKRAWIGSKRPYNLTDARAKIRWFLPPAELRGRISA